MRGLEMLVWAAPAAGKPRAPVRASAQGQCSVRMRGAQGVPRKRAGAAQPSTQATTAAACRQGPRSQQALGVPDAPQSTRFACSAPARRQKGGMSGAWRVHAGMAGRPDGSGGVGSPDRPGMERAMSVQLRAPCFAMLRRRSSSSCAHRNSFAMGAPGATHAAGRQRGGATCTRMHSNHTSTLTSAHGLARGR